RRSRAGHLVSPRGLTLVYVAGASGGHAASPPKSRTPCCSRVLSDSARYSADRSMPTYRRPLRVAASPVVPEPLIGSSTVPPGLQPASTHRSARETGMTAECASGNGLVGIDQTSPRLRPPSGAES